MKIQRSVLDEGVAGLSLTGEFDSFAANPFLEQIETIIQTGVANVVVNLRLVLFINSTAVGSLIKARKRLRGLAGDLVLSEASARVSDTLKALGLDQVIRGFGSDEAAISHLTQSGGGAVDVPSNAVLLHFSDAAKQKAFASAGRASKMASLEETSIQFTTEADPELFTRGTEVKVKFRLPLFRRAYYFDVPCTVRSAEKTGQGLKVTADFGDIFEEDRRAIAQFVRDMRLLREETRSAEG